MGRAQGGSHSAHIKLEANPCIPYQECMRIFMLTIMKCPRPRMLLPAECTQISPWYKWHVPEHAEAQAESLQDQ